MGEVRGLSAGARERCGSCVTANIGAESRRTATRHLRRTCLAVVLAAAVSLLGAAGATAQAPAVKVLVYHGAPDATVNAGVAAIEALGADNDFTVDDTQ